MQRALGALPSSYLLRHLYHGTRGAPERPRRAGEERAMTETLPAIDPAVGRSAERLDRAREERVTELFRRWPELSEAERAELRSLWNLHIAERRRSGSRH